MTCASDGTPDLAGLAAFTRLNDRDEAWFFSGRGAEIDEIERLCTEALDRARQGQAARSATRLFQGAPGAGKTALLTALQQRWDERARNARVHDPIGSPAGIPLVVELELGDFASEEVVVRCLLDEVAPEVEMEARETRLREVSAEAGFSGIRGGGKTGVMIAPRELSLRELARVLPPRDWTRPVCLMVDEIQNVGSEAKNLLVTLHKGNHGLPIVPLYAGLGSSLDVLATHGLSRLGVTAVHDIGALAPEEAQGAVRMMFERYRVDLEGVDHDWPSELASLSECWPQHLHNAMRALAEGLSADVWLLLIPHAFWTGIGTIAPSATAGAYRRPWTKRAVWSARSWPPCRRRACGLDRFWPRLRASRRRTWIPSGACRTA